MAGTITYSDPGGQSVYPSFEWFAGAPEGSMFQAAANVYAALLFARDACGPTDPLNQRNTVGWKAAGTACTLNDEFKVRVESCSLA